MRRNPTAIASLVVLSILVADKDLSARQCDFAEGQVDECIDARLMLPSEHVRNTNELVVVLRVLDACEQAVQVTLVQEEASAEVKAIAEVASFDSVSTQLCELSKRHPDRTPDALCEDVMLRKIEAPPPSGDRLATQISALRKRAVSPILEPEYFLHGMVYDLWFFSVFSESRFHFYGPRWPTSPRPPLETWARETLALFDTACREGDS